MTDAEQRAEIAIKVFGWKVIDRGPRNLSRGTPRDRHRTTMREG